MILWESSSASFAKYLGRKTNMTQLHVSKYQIECTRIHVTKLGVVNFFNNVVSVNYNFFEL